MEPPIIGPDSLESIKSGNPCQPTAQRYRRLSKNHSAWRGNSDFIAACWMTVSIICVSLAMMMRVGDGRHVYFLSWQSPIPETCLLAQRFGIDCPGCGLTRCFIQLAHGQLRQAWTINAVGIAIFLFAFLQIAFGFAQVVLRKRNGYIEAWGRYHDWIVMGLLLALVLQWSLRLTGRMLL